MFSLIITIVSIALVVALVAATMYHGGDTLTQGRTTADASAFVAGAQQIGGAAVMFLSLEGKAATDVTTDLVGKKYIASQPSVKGSSLAIGTKDIALHNIVSSTVTDDAVCTQINKSANVADAKQSSAAEADFAALPYGCVSATKTFQFKY